MTGAREQAGAAQLWRLPDPVCRVCGGILREGAFGVEHFASCWQEDHEGPCDMPALDLGHGPEVKIINQLGEIVGASPSMRYEIRPVFDA